MKLKLARGQERGVDDGREHQQEGGHGQGGHELADQQVGPHVDLVGGRGLDVLDRARLDDGEQALGVTLGALGHGSGRGGHRGGRGRGGRGGGGLRCRAAGAARPAARPAGGRGSCSPSSAAPAAGAAAGRRRRRRAAGRGGRAAGRPGARPTGAAGVRERQLMGSAHLLAAYSGPEMPPSLRTRQKWMAMKMTMTNGNMQHMEHVPSEQGVGADLDSAQEHEPHLVPEHRRVADHVRAHRDRPQGQLVPRAAGSR